MQFPGWVAKRQTLGFSRSAERSSGFLQAGPAHSKPVSTPGTGRGWTTRGEPASSLDCFGHPGNTGLATGEGRNLQLHRTGRCEKVPGTVFPTVVCALNCSGTGQQRAQDFLGYTAATVGGQGAPHRSTAVPSRGRIGTLTTSKVRVCWPLPLHLSPSSARSRVNSKCCLRGVRPQKGRQH